MGLDASRVVEKHGRPLDERWAVHNLQGLDGNLQGLEIKVTQKTLEKLHVGGPHTLKGT